MLAIERIQQAGITKHDKARIDLKYWDGLTIDIPNNHVTLSGKYDGNNWKRNG
jgi:hypothetical protein